VPRADGGGERGAKIAAILTKGQDLMANVTVFRNDYDWNIPPAPGGHVYFWLEAPALGSGSINVTAFPIYAPERLLEVTQVAVRGDYAGRKYLDIVVRNNGSVSVGGFVVYTSVITP
jgi:hypothetical protein